jgi:dolichyl-phosphate-mannose-protein mannosyltransferase
MDTKTKRRLIIVALSLIVALSAYLRLSGITWGMKGVAGMWLEPFRGGAGYGHYLSFHPDEFISIRGMWPINLRAGKLKAPDAYFEGSFNYYLWAVPRLFHDLYSGKSAVGHQNLSANELRFILLSGRLMSVAFDLATAVFLFLIIREVTKQQVPAILGALLYGVIPMQVIYSHFMRTYTLANLLCVLVIWLSLKALKHRHWWLFLITGIAAGLAAATRYPAVFILSVPCGMVLLKGDVSDGPWRQRLAKSFVYLLSGPLWLLAFGFVLGFFIGEPMLFFDFRSVIDAVVSEASQYAPAGARNLFDLRPIWKYLSVLIPHATYPVLWLVIYASIIYVIFRPSLWPAVVPVLLFAMLYLYSMAKGYLDAFARLTMLLMPVLCIFVGLACGEIFPKLVKRPLAFRLVITVLLLLTLPSIVFDWAYGQAMTRRDVRELLRNDMRASIADRSATSIGVSEGGCYFYTAMPAVLPLQRQNKNVAVQLESALGTTADFLVIGFERPLSEALRDSTIRKVESGGSFRFVKAYSRAPTVFGRRLDLSDFPVDMTYPFPTILLFAKTITP